MARKPLVYLAGAMRHREDLNFPMFDEWTKELRRQGYRVVNPADLDRAVGFDPTVHDADQSFVHEALRRDIEALLTCDALALLPDWKGSAGVKVELTVARAIGLPVLNCRTMQPMTERVIRRELAA